MAAILVFLGRLEDLAGQGFEELSLSAPLDWANVLKWLKERYSAALVDAVIDERVKVAINGEVFADKVNLVLHDGDELAFLPPVSGG